jgi:hypothetical protein
MATTTLDNTGTIHRSRRDELADLASDLTATAITSTGTVDTAAVHHRPSILRRLAALLAQQIGPEVDRIIADPADTALATAVSLHTGIPFVTIAPDAHEGSVHGDLHASERVVVVSTITTADRQLMKRNLNARDVEVSSTLTAISTSSDQTGSVYRLSHGALEPGQEYPS